MIRHPPPDIASGICYGQSDVPVRQSDCHAIAKQLQPCMPVDAPLFSSPLQRCLQLAQLLHTTPRCDSRLMEMDFGSWEMQSWRQIARHEVDSWAADVVHYSPGGSENVLAMATRIIAFAEEMICLPCSDIVIVCHAGCIRLLMQWQPGMSAATLAARTCEQQRHFEFGSCTLHTLLI
ncbi:histidine phosphatase family protein [Undibacterium sp. SXout7W]|uniref:histidine phosphatase family protein n=1 Tax=Undibacterium sp. SXout7W TaxID=3413049 RepID=UPI003BF228A9